MNKILDKAMELVNAIKESNEIEDIKVDDIKDIESYLSKFPEYFNAVISYCVTIHFISLRYDGQEYRDRVMELDNNRRIKHIAVATSVNKLNRLAKLYGTEKVIDIDRELDADSVDDREIGANLVFQFCVETFLDEMTRTGYNIVGNMDHDLQIMSDKRISFDERRLHIPEGM